MTAKDLRTLLEYHGLSQLAFARLSGISPRNLRRLVDTKRAHPIPLGAEARIRQALENHGNGMSS
jgi:transcriptional regulator with XRE-family HTH domain